LVFFCSFCLFFVHLVYFMAIWYIFCPFGIFFLVLVYISSFWYIFPRFGIFFLVSVYFSSFWYIVLRKIASPAPSQGRRGRVTVVRMSPRMRNFCDAAFWYWHAIFLMQKVFFQFPFPFSASDLI
jgi:hypothetical protein